MAEHARRNDPAAFTRPPEAKPGPVAGPETASSDLLTLQRTAGNAAVVDLLERDVMPAPAATVKRSSDLTVHRFYVECEPGDAGASMGSDLDSETFFYKWIAGRRDESLYVPNPRETGWAARNLYKLKDGAPKPAPTAALGAKKAEATPGDEGGGITVEGSAKYATKGKGEGEAAIGGSWEAGETSPKPAKEKRAEAGGMPLPELEVSADLAEATFKDDALKALGKTYKASGTGTLSVDKSGFSGEGSLTAERAEGATKSSVKLNGIETASKGSSSTEKLAAKGAVEMGSLSAEVSQATAGPSKSTTVTQADGSSRTDAITEDARSRKASAKLAGGALSGSVSQSSTALTESVSLDAGNTLGEHTTGKAKGDLAIGAESQTLKGSVGSRPAAPTEGVADPGTVMEVGGEYSSSADLAKVTGEASMAYARGGMGAAGKVTGSAGVGGSYKVGGKASSEGVSGELSSFVGASADTSATVSLKVADKDVASFKGTMGLTFGVGGSVSGAMSWKGGKISWQASGKAAVGLGGSFSYNVELDTWQVAGLIADGVSAGLDRLDLFGFNDMQIDFT